MNSKLGNWGRALLIGLAGTALVATTLATSEVRACVRGHELGSDACSISQSGLTLSIGPVRILLAP
jgi:hypothetical protein